MGGIKYYQLAKDEELPDEFCAIKYVGGEPSEYTFYAPEAENAKLRHDLEEANNQAEEVCIENAKLRELAKEAVTMAREFYNLGGTYNDLDELLCEASELGIEVGE